MTKQTTDTKEITSTTLLLGIYCHGNKIKDPDLYYQEFISLVDTLGVAYDFTHFIKLRSYDKAHFLTKGKLEALLDFCEQNNVEHIICSELLTPLQERNLENILDCHLFDREQLILEIFRKAAHTAEGKIQVEMAHIEYLKSRMAGKGREFMQQEGRVGSRGPGETAKETLKRFFADRLRQAKKRLDTLQKSRDIQRKRRLESKIPLVCLVGYTNAGKSSLLNTLTQSDILAENKLFATLDTTTRELFLPGNKKVLISDTVGFISQLPTHLIQAFRATLEELNFAHYLLHIIDASNPSWLDHIKVVRETLRDLNVDAQQLYVFNKADLLNKEELATLKELSAHLQPQVMTHAMSKDGVAPLVHALAQHFAT